MLTENGFLNIISIISHFGGELVDWLEYIKDMIGMVGLPGLVIMVWAILPLLLIILMINFVNSNFKQSKMNNDAMKQNNDLMAKQIGNLAIAISNLSDKVQNPPMGVEDSLEYFYLIMHEHITKKLTYLGDILRKNSIAARKTQIQKNIENEFRAITTKGATKLSRKRSVCGDMGKILQENLDWQVFLGDVYNAFFVSRDKNCDDCDHFKIQDIKTIMYGKVDIIAKIIEENGVHNNS